MFKYTVMIVVIVNSALHHLTGAGRGSDIGFSSCTAPTSYSCLSISGAFWGLQGIPEVLEVVQEFGSNPELECSPERGEHRG